jgi:hypothetical protein
MVVCIQVEDQQAVPHFCVSTVESPSQAGKVILFTLVLTLGNVLMVVASVGRPFVMGEPFANTNEFTQVSALMSAHFVPEHLTRRW